MGRPVTVDGDDPGGPAVLLGDGDGEPDAGAVPGLHAHVGAALGDGHVDRLDRTAGFGQGDVAQRGALDLEDEHVAVGQRREPGRAEPRRLTEEHALAHDPGCAGLRRGRRRPEPRPVSTRGPA